MPGCGFHRSGRRGSFDATISMRSAAISPIAGPAVVLERVTAPRPSLGDTHKVARNPGIDPP